MLCALDYALAESVNDAAIKLFERQVIGALACLPVSDLWPQSAQSLTLILSQTDKSCLIGAQLSITGQFSPLSAGFEPTNGLEDGALPSRRDLSKAARHFLLDQHLIEAEFRAQIRRFMAHMDMKPDFIMLDETILLFGSASLAVSSMLAHFQLENLPVLVPPLARPDGLTDRINRSVFWQSSRHQKEKWMRRMLVILSDSDRIPPKSSWQLDSKIWYALRPALDAEGDLARLERFGEDAEKRERQMGWFEAL